MIAVSCRTWMMTIVCLAGTCAASASGSLSMRLRGEPGIAAIANVLANIRANAPVWRIATDPFPEPSDAVAAWPE
jgi:hypothetical protein